MKLECGKDKLVKAVGIAERLTGKNLSLPILKNILLLAQKDNLLIRATNLELGVEIVVPAKIKQPGSLTVSGSPLVGFLSNLGSDQKTNIEAGEEKLVITSGPHSAVLKIEPTEDFPVIPKVKGSQSLIIPTEDLASGLRSVMFAASLSHIKPEIASVYVYQEGQELFFVATDSFRLAEKKLNIKNATKEPVAMIIPHKNALEILRICEVESGEAELNFDNNQISILTNGVYLTSRLVDGSFPDYRQIIPKEHQTEVVVLKDDLQKIIKLSSFFSDKFYRADWEIISETKKLNIKTHSENGESTSGLAAAIEGQELMISFNLKYLSEALSTLSTDSVSLKFSGGNKPILVTGVGDLSFRYLIMPINR